MTTFTRSEKHTNADFLSFWKINSKSYYSKMKQNNSTEFSGYSPAPPIVLVKNPQSNTRNNEKMYGGVQSLEISDYQKKESKMRPRFSYIFLNSLVLNTGSTGPSKVNMFEVPKIISKVLQPVQGHSN